MQRSAFRGLPTPTLTLGKLQPFRYNPVSPFAASDSDDAPYADVPRPQKKPARKPYPTPMKVLIRRAKEERKAAKENPCRLLQPPDNGLLVPELLEVAHRVNQARESLLHGLSKLLNVAVPVKRCRFCSEVHIGQVGHEIRSCKGPKSGFRSATHVWRTGGMQDVVRFSYCYHLHDRVGKPRVSHHERFQIKKLPAVLELCIQAGLDLEDYPTKRRTRPVYSIEGRIADFEPEIEETETLSDSQSCSSGEEEEMDSETRFSAEFSGARAIDVEKSSPTHFDEEGERATETGCPHNNCGEEEKTEFSLSEVSAKTMESWLEMRRGAETLMRQYSVNTCGYCPEVQVGSKGHKVRWCKAPRHQFRNGLHAWQEATIDDLIGPNYVWHLRDLEGPALANELKRYYGKAPAVVELCVQAGAPIPKEYRSMMRLDVVPPNRDEIDLVA